MYGKASGSAKTYHSFPALTAPMVPRPADTSGSASRARYGRGSGVYGADSLPRRSPRRAAFDHVRRERERPDDHRSAADQAAQADGVVDLDADIPRRGAHRTALPLLPRAHEPTHAVARGQKERSSLPG